MSNARDTLAKVVTDQMADTGQQVYGIADAIIAALPGLVRPLEWYDCPDNTSHDADCRYEISPHKYGFRLIKGVTGGGAYICDVSSRDIAKSAAQRHHVAQIMKAFGISDANPSTPQRQAKP